LVNPFIDGLFEAECAASPFVYVDVGARGGIDQRWTPFKKHFLAVAVEADEAAYQDLVKMSKADPTLRPVFATLHNTPGEIILHVTRKAAVSSVLQPNKEVLGRFPDAERFDVVRTLRLETTTLDAALQANGIGEIDFLKIDTQGSSLWVLQGARQALASAYGVEVETEFVPLYQGQPLFNEVDRFMQENGFELFDINRFYWKRRKGNLGGSRGQLGFGDALYLRAPEELVKHATNQAKAKIVKATLASLAYGYLDLAIALWDQALEKSIVSREEYRTAIAYIERNTHVATGLAKMLPKRLKLARVFQWLADFMLRGSVYACDGRLGNTVK
jgi:FkbM family methyltransferase